MSDVTANANDWFNGLSGASQGGGGNWINGGVYDLEILAIARKVSADPAKKKARLVIAEFRVTSVVVGYPAENYLGAPFPASNRVGERVSVMVNLDGDYPSLEMGKLKGILEAALGPADAELKAAFGAEDAADPWMVIAGKVTEPPGTTLSGTVIRCNATRKLTAKRKQPIAELTFSAVPVE